MGGDARYHQQHHQATQSDDAVGQGELDHRFVDPPQPSHQRGFSFSNARRQQQGAQRR